MIKTRTRVVGLISSKGGVGRSTLTVNLAAEVLKEGAKVAILDAEPQGSATLWWKLRGRPTDIEVVTKPDDPEADVRSLRVRGFDWIFVDTVPMDMAAIRDAIAASDYVVIPTRVSAFDLAATSAVVGLCRDLKRPFAFVLNQVDPSWEKGTFAAIKALKKFGPVIPKVLRFRTVYASSLTMGRTASEATNAKEAKEASAEVAAVWAAIKKEITSKERAGR
jgi:chromosome partitioning protein